MIARGLWLLLVLCLACGARVPRTRSALDAARLKKAALLHAKERAPELWRELEQARAAAAGAKDDAELRADQDAIARLWLEAAIAECERADLAAQRLVIEREIEGLYAAALRDQKRSTQLTDEAARKAAAAIARNEAMLALERAATIPSRRPKLDKQAESSAARALIGRAQLVIESARALGAQASALTEASALVDRASAALPAHSDQALDAADRALSQALIALGPMRASHGAVSQGDKQALVDDLQVLGARLTRGDQGLVAQIDDVQGVGGSSSATAPRRLARLCAVALAHPHGPVRFVVAAENPQTGARQAAALTQALSSAGCTGERFGVESRALGQASGRTLELLFLAY